MITLIPMAGAGSRFAKVGYALPKPLIPVSGKPMVINAVNALPESEKHIFICREEHIKNHQLDDKLHAFYPNATILSIDHLTEGQACTCLLAEQFIDTNESLIIGACDNGMLYDHADFEKQKDDNDCLVFTFRNNTLVNRKPEQYGWVEVDEKQLITNVSVKKPISDQPINDHAVVGAFWFREGRLFVNAAKKLIEKNIRINNEFYVDSVINEVISMGYRAKVIEIDYYIGWGTPQALKTYEYWESFYKNNNA